RTISAVSETGRMYIPHVLKEVRPIGTPGTADYKGPVGFQPLDPSRPNPKVIPIPKDIKDIVVDGMWSVVNAGGTAGSIKMDGFDIAGKTGTAQVVSLGKDTGKNKDHSWFVSYAPAFKPEIAMVALIENSGFGGHHAAPAVRGVYNEYYRKTRHQEPPGTLPKPQIAKTDTPKQTKPATAVAAQQPAVVSNQ
ncbi:MAG TPA: penicillin-binding transpeptidase domain-containing protein, partial [Pyrinomonadaceae bacterium]|nr:penicillin-binding transpeptidase domain-containing protein [Pyrinomonadaceae bacterium]